MDLFTYTVFGIFSSIIFLGLLGEFLWGENPNAGGYLIMDILEAKGLKFKDGK